MESAADPSARPTLDEELWLLGQPSLQDYVTFVKESAVGVSKRDVPAFIEEWRAANEYYQELEKSELGAADEAECRDPHPSLATAIAALEADPRFFRAFEPFPTRITMVELDKLVVCQRSVTHNFVQGLARRIGSSPAPLDLLRFCFPVDETPPPFQVHRAGSRRYIFRSPSMDFRFREPVLLKAEDLREAPSFGAVAGMVGLIVGFGSNFLNALEVGGRYLLNNGYHRACALRTAGLTHAPCVVQTINSWDEVELAAKSSVVRAPSFFFRSARPPLLKDFFDPKIRKSLLVKRQMRMIEVSFEVRDYLMPE